MQGTDKPLRLLCNHQCFIGFYHQRLHARSICTDHSDVSIRGYDLIAIIVNAQAQKLESLQYTAAHGAAVFTNTRGKHDGIYTAHGCGIRADVLSRTMCEYIDCQACAIIALLRTVFYLAQIITMAR